MKFDKHILEKDVLPEYPLDFFPPNSKTQAKFSIWKNGEFKYGNSSIRVSVATGVFNNIEDFNEDLIIKKAKELNTDHLVIAFNNDKSKFSAVAFWYKG